MAHTVAGLFDTPAQARSAVERIIDAGVPKENIGLACRDVRSRDNAQGVQDLATNTGTGAMVGGLGGLLLGLGALAIPGIGPIVAAGPIAATLAGAGIGAAGGLMVGALRDSGIPEDEAHVYAESVRRGCTLVSVKNVPDSLSARVCDIMDSAGAADIEERADRLRRDGWARFDHRGGPYSGEPMTPAATGRGRARTYTSETSGREVF